jgi:predicted restriction endonuclease
MVAQVCDLLDGAAAWAGTPLLALRYVKASTGEFNEKAFLADPMQSQYREAILARSIEHAFSDDDFGAISKALEGDLFDLSNKTAWDKVHERYGKEGILIALAKGESAKADALHDIGSETPDTRLYNVRVFARNDTVRRMVLIRAGGYCEFCGSEGFRKPDGSIYIESHHIIALAKDGEDRLTNVIGLCPNHHREAHFGECRDDIERQMAKIVRVKCGT